MYILILIPSKFIDMDNLGKYLISDEDEPQPKSRKLKSSSSKQNPIKKSNFSQVKINLYEKNYRIWIQRNNSKIYEFFKFKKYF
jgi:hypothetical protein